MQSATGMCKVRGEAAKKFWRIVTWVMTATWRGFAVMEPDVMKSKRLFPLERKI